MFEITSRVFYQVMMGCIYPLKKIGEKYKVNFRCWPVDMDYNIHLNNAKYFRVAELSRWRIGTGTGFIPYYLKRKLLFLVVEQNAKYLKPIGPFQKYSLMTSLSTIDNKYLLYTHTFEEFIDEANKTTTPKVYAVIEVKAVIKETNGKTVRPSEIENLGYTLDS